MNASSAHAYSFEREKYSHRSYLAAQNAFRIFVERLKLPTAWTQLKEDHLVKYVTDVHLNIAWYDKKVKAEKSIRNLYVAITLALLLVMPILILMLNSLAERITETSSEQDPDYLIAQVAALITGVLALHSGIAAWFEQRKVIGNFWKASADLKEALYDLEDKWRQDKSEDWSNEMLEKFEEEISLGIKFAKRVVRKEKETFFKNYKTPRFDIVSLILNNSKKAEDLAEIFLDPGTLPRQKAEKEADKIAQELAEELAEAQIDVRRYQQEVEELRKLIELRLQQLSESQTEEEQNALRAGLKELQVKLERAETNLISARARVTSLTTVNSLIGKI